MRPPPVTALKGERFLPAVCTVCGHEGRSQRPEYYRCGACYYEQLARASIIKAETYEMRAAAERRDAEEHQARALEARMRQERNR